MTPTARSLAELRARTCFAQVVERFNTFTKRRHDLFGVIDIVALDPTEHSILGIQATGGDGGNHAARRTKILAEPRALEWLRCGARLQIWSWAKRGERGKRKLWTLRIEEIVEADFAAVEGAAP